MPNRYRWFKESFRSTGSEGKSASFEGAFAPPNEIHQRTPPFERLETRRHKLAERPGDTRNVYTVSTSVLEIG
jgi:hypothetical protein